MLQVSPDSTNEDGLTALHQVGTPEFVFSSYNLITGFLHTGQFFLVRNCHGNENSKEK